MLADVVQRTDVRVIQRGDGARFTVEALPELRIGCELRGENLDGDDAVEPRIAGPIDLAHAAGAKGGLNLVWAEPVSWLEWQAVVARLYPRPDTGLKPEA